MDIQELLMILYLFLAWAFAFILISQSFKSEVILERMLAIIYSGLFTLLYWAFIIALW